MKHKNIFYFLIVIIFFVVGFSLINSQKIIKEDLQVKNFDINKVQYVKIAGKTFKVDLALTQEEQQRGLSGRKELKEDESMLFIFDHSDKYSFWMKDMNFPIDIVWVSGDFRVVYIKKDAKPESYPDTFTPTENARYVLEIKALFSEKNNLKVGDEVKFLSS
ncbi:MAG: DUF192 domain-containing protein [Candidatus Paceibacterota bacterium]